ncbi:MAG: DUF4397 domain-containing protein [Chloroflexota bacterium]
MRKLTIALLALVLLIAGAYPAMAQDGDAHLRVAHLSFDAGEVDVYIDGEVALASVPFGVVSDWMVVPAASYSVAVAPAGTSIDDAVIGPVDLALDADGWFTVAAIGLAGDATLTAQVIEEDYSDITLGEIRVTIFHAIPNADPVSVIADEENVLVAGLAYPGSQEGSDGLVTIDGLLGGTYDLQVVLTDTPDAVVFDLPGTELTERRNIFIAAAGLADEPELVFVSTNPDEVGGDMMAEDDMMSSDAHIRVAHLSEDAPAVDVYINGEVSEFVGVEYPALSDFVTVPAGTYSVAVAPAGTSLDDAVIGPVDITVDGGAWYTVAAIGLVADGSLTAQVLVDDFSEIPTGQARFTVFHASPGAPPVDVLVNEEPFVQTLAFPGTFEDNDGAATFTVLAGAYDLAVTANEDPDTVFLSADGFNLEPGSNYFIAAINTVDDLDLFISTLSAAEISDAMN